MDLYLYSLKLHSQDSRKLVLVSTKMVQIIIPGSKFAGRGDPEYVKYINIKA